MSKKEDRNDECSWIKTATMFISGAVVGAVAATYAEDIVEYIGDIVDNTTIEIPEQ